jgi:spermidine/putrescine transport system ATP-binding protein
MRQTGVAPVVGSGVSADGELAAIELVGVNKRFPAPGGTVVAVEDVALSVAPGEFFSLLGPSGCGKTTTLRMLAGFEEPTSGRILLYGREMVGVPPYRRDVNMVFQHYALFPHMNVRDNIAFGLRHKKVPKDEIERRVAESLRLVELEGREQRRPRQLSGGQQQRVALARALVNRPRALLLDEPLGALDLKLRRAMQLELKRIQREVGITFVYVTHDQEEALTMSDRLAVMNAGRIEQLGTPQDLYERPATRFVADFLGTSNIIGGRLERRDQAWALAGLGEGERVLLRDADGLRAGQRVEIVVRPEKMALHADEAPPPPSHCVLRGTVAEVVYLGTSTTYSVRTMGGAEVVVYRQNAATAAGDEVVAGQAGWLSWLPEHSYVLEPPADAASDAIGEGAGP